MDIRNYIITAEVIDWRTLLSYWVPPLPEKFTLWFVNRCGDVFVTTPDGAVLRLDVGTGTCSGVAQSREEFARLLDVPANTDEWLRIRVVDACVHAGMVLAPDECYGFKVPPALQGTYDVSNLSPTKLDTHYSWMAHLSRQDSIYWTGP